ncbi:ABC transporter substrate-binding protein [Roseomonas sp. JC162]|uniref:ABC transporter substrate-binding protein n=1 Tax=Neoroseomonas marina TaxID=1232220 RepID=A0A848EAM2_9PROT|nr:ABC transporter substrate-binding protein [Neoroseomonas marina]NMJ41554.1 ABC transporter substrate-binding protein [Neoroseomonas marina]
MTSRRRLIHAVSTALVLPAPATRAQPVRARTLRFVPQADLTILDPIVTSAYVTRNHALLVYDTLYGLDASLRPVPQMVEGHLVEDEGRRWTFRLRDGLAFHDGERVRARDCVASIRRWWRRDPLGQLLAMRTDEISAADDRTFTIRLARPFGPMLDALGKLASPICAIMPERIANTDPWQPQSDVVGSGPFCFRAEERVPGALAVYERFEGYRPRSGGNPEWTAGPKRVWLDRVEWHTLPDPATAAAALQRREVDWWEQPAFDLLPLLRRRDDVTVVTTPLLGTISICRFNHLQPPFDNVALRRALLGALNQADFMTAVAGAAPDAWRDGVGIWPPGSPLATGSGIEAITAPRDLERSRHAIREAGYRGERIVSLVSADFPTGKAAGEVGSDLFRRLGLNVDHVATDWGTVAQRRSSREPVERGGWSCFYTGFASLDLLNPGVHQLVRGGGERAWFGWPSIPRMEDLASDWIDAPDLDAQRRIAVEMQRLAFVEVPYLPLGQYFQPTAYRRELDGVLAGPPVFWNIKRQA